MTGSNTLHALAAGTLVLAYALSACGGSSSTTPPMNPVEDLSFLAYVDDAGDGMPYAHDPRMIHLSDYFAAKKPGTKIIMLNAAAGWCGPCMHEASVLADFAAAYAPRGVVVLTSVFQKADGTPADADFVKAWGEAFKLPIPTLIDSAFVTGKYFDAHTMPANLFVNAETTELLNVVTGAEPGDDPMKAYRELLDHYLNAK